LARVRQIREARGLSQEAFAERAGLKYKHYQAIEAGRKTDIRLSTLVKLTKACSLELKDLLDFELSPMALAENTERYEAKVGSRRRDKVPSRRAGLDRA
jgi:transcriptional regulator with XRE-family HTH domain